MVVWILLLHIVTIVFQQLIVCRHAWSILAESVQSGLAKILFYMMPNIFLSSFFLAVFLIFGQQSQCKIQLWNTIDL